MKPLESTVDVLKIENDFTFCAIKINRRQCAFIKSIHRI